MNVRLPRFIEQIRLPTDEELRALATQTLGQRDATQIEQLALAAGVIRLLDAKKE